MLGKSETQCIESRKLILRFQCNTAECLAETIGLEQQYGAKVEVIAYTARLIVGNRMRLSSVLGFLIMVGIYHSTLWSRQIIDHSFQCHFSPLQYLWLGIDKQVGSRGLGCNLCQGRGRIE